MIFVPDYIDDFNNLTSNDNSSSKYVFCNINYNYTETVASIFYGKISRCICKKKSKEDSSLVTIRKVTKALQSVNSKFFSLKVYVLLLFALSFFILFN